MGFRRIDLRTITNKKSREDYRNLSRRYTWCDKNIAFPYLRDLGIVIVSHPGNRGFLKASIETHSKLKSWITLAYDNHFDVNPKTTWDSKMPNPEIIPKINALVMGPRSRWSGVLYPYFWLIRLGVNTMREFKYLYCTNGDCIIEKPEGILELLEELKEKDGDLLSTGYWERKNSTSFNSLGFLGRTEAIIKMMDHFEENFIPLKTYERTTQEFGNCETRMGRAVKDLKLKNITVPKNPLNAQMYSKEGTWYEKAGFRHLHSEHNHFIRYGSDDCQPPELKYYDKPYVHPVNMKKVEEWWKNNA